MSWELALGYVKALVWPIVVLLLGFVFKRQIAALFTRIESLQTPVGSATFQRLAEAVGREAAEEQSALIADLGSGGSEQGISDLADLNQERPHGLDGEDNSGEPTRSFDSDGENDETPPPPSSGASYSYQRIRSDPVAFSALENLASSDPTGAVLGAWREVESALRHAQSDGFAEGSRNIADALQWVERQGFVPPAVIRSAHDLRELRNRVVHGGDLLLTVDGARSYVRSARQVVDTIALSRSPEVMARSYEAAVNSALWKISSEVVAHFRDYPPDFSAIDHGGRLALIETKYRTRGKFTASDVERVVSQVRSRSIFGGLLVVTNIPLAQSAREFNSRENNDSDRPVEVIQWVGPQDDALLARALGRVSMTPDPGRG
ncbi:hypothetical protein [Streptomyces sp. CA2R106]|uniref:hypothetical protein n=1 Tax=Streptomyces sp. CA2R106 TaxID=3120153 RepID=UPI00300AA93C